MNTINWNEYLKAIEDLLGKEKIATVELNLGLNPTLNLYDTKQLELREHVELKPTAYAELADKTADAAMALMLYNVMEHLAQASEK